mmetsp:Transcript_47839/g.93447  ORF Transcript_47839/g.93447 Transcript_47839/m.93447 type:complete len:202 (-) Transcript_47839:207-812(-)
MGIVLHDTTTTHLCVDPVLRSFPQLLSGVHIIPRAPWSRWLRRARVPQVSSVSSRRWPDDAVSSDGSTRGSSTGSGSGWTRGFMVTCFAFSNTNPISARRSARSAVMPTHGLPCFMSLYWSRILCTQRPRPGYPLKSWGTTQCPYSSLNSLSCPRRSSQDFLGVVGSRARFFPAWNTNPSAVSSRTFSSVRLDFFPSMKEA